MTSIEIPNRSHMEDPLIEWKDGKPDYTVVNRLYLEGKSRNHQADSLEKLVENLVKTWEMESQHKANKKDWQSVDKDTFNVVVNGKTKFNLDENIKQGNYNMLLDTCPMYDPSAETNHSSHQLFKKALPGGFAWELQDLFSGPPKVTFKWRHWGRWEGEYKGNESTGEELEMFGICVVTVTSELKIQTIEVYYDPSQTLATLLNFDRKTLCPKHKK